MLAKTTRHSAKSELGSQWLPRWESKIDRHQAPSLCRKMGQGTAFAHGSLENDDVTKTDGI